MMKRIRKEECLHCSKSITTMSFPKSPVNVADFARMIEFGVQPNVATGLMAPCLSKHWAITTAIEAAMKDSVTESCSTDDEVLSFSSSLSSHSQNEEDLDLGFEIQSRTSSNSRKREENRRSIFSHYWKNTGQEPLELIREQPRSLPRSPRKMHLSLMAKETAPAPVSPKKSPSRSIFGLPTSENLSSMQSLPEMRIISSSERLQSNRRTRSTSCLHTKRLPSCLRKSERSIASSSSVSFNAKVQVITFQAPVENWSDGSWTKVFGSH
jgi:hypothetical protein